MSVSAANPSRPRAVRVVGLQEAASSTAATVTSQCVTRPPQAGGSRAAEKLDRLVRAEPAQALRVLEDWLEDGETHYASA